MTWPCTDPAYRKDGDEMDLMSWKCACGAVNLKSWGRCNTCGADRYVDNPAGLSEEERAALAAHNAGRAECGWLPVTATELGASHMISTVAEYRAARAPLEAENAKLREHVRELETERDRYRDGFHKASAVAEQLSQAQKRNSSLQYDLTYAAELLGTADPAAKAANLETAVDLLRRLARDESLIVREGAERGLEIIQAQKPAAPPPGEVSTPNLDRWEHDEGHSSMREALLADIRAAVAAERAKLDSRVTGLEEALERVRQERERVRRDLTGQRDDLRAKLETAEKASAARIAELKEFNQGLGTRLDASEKLSEQRRLQIFDLHMASERRQPVDRERAIGTVMELIAQVRGTGFPSDVDAARETLDAILGAAKAEPDAKLVTPEFVAFVECIAAGGEGRDVVAWAEHLLKMMRAEPSAFTPAPTGEVPSEELRASVPAETSELRSALVSLFLEHTELDRDEITCLAEDTEAAFSRYNAALERRVSNHTDLARELAAQVKRVRELEMVADRATTERNAYHAEVERLKAAASNRRCPADGMSDEELGRKVRDNYQSHWTWANACNIPEILRDSGASIRELFTPAAPANDERKPKVGDEVWYQGKMRKVLKLGQHEFRVAMGNKNDAYLEDDNVGTWLRHDSCGFTWWRSDPSAKGAE